LLKPGMTAQVRIVVASKTDVVRIPTAALRFKPDEDETEGRLRRSALRQWRRHDSSASATARQGRSRAASAASADDDGLLAARRDGARIFRVYTVGAGAEARNCVR
jgi:HlyD family secretion protein